jgi:hypothetical protein
MSVFSLKYFNRYFSICPSFTFIVKSAVCKIGFKKERTITTYSLKQQATEKFRGGHYRLLSIGGWDVVVCQEDEKGGMQLLIDILEAVNMSKEIDNVLFFQ